MIIPVLKKNIQFISQLKYVKLRPGAKPRFFKKISGLWQREQTPKKQILGLVKFKGVSPSLYTKVILEKSPRNSNNLKNFVEGRKLGLLINPIIFHVAVKIYETEKRLRQNILATDKKVSEELKLSLSSYYIGAKMNFDKTLEWWDDVSEHVPGLVTVTVLLDGYVQLFMTYLEEITIQNERVRKMAESQNI